MLPFLLSDSGSSGGEIVLWNNSTENARNKLCLNHGRALKPSSGKCKGWRNCCSVGTQTNLGLGLKYTANDFVQPAMIAFDILQIVSTTIVNTFTYLIYLMVLPLGQCINNLQVALNIIWNWDPWSRRTVNVHLPKHRKSFAPLPPTPKCINCCWETGVGVVGGAQAVASRTSKLKPPSPQGSPFHLPTDGSQRWRS